MSTVNQVFVKRVAAADNTDSLVKSGKAEIELRNGDIVAIGDKTNGVYALSAPAEGTTAYGIVYNADFPRYKGIDIGDDPRDLVFPAGTVVNVFIPKKGDELAYTVVAGTASGAKFLNPTAGDTALTYSATQATTGFSLKINGTGFVSVGGERIKTVEAEVVAE